MGTWDVGPFDNDDAADFAVELDDAPPQARIEMIGAILERVAGPADHDSRLSDIPRAVAAAALGSEILHWYGHSSLAKDRCGGRAFAMPLWTCSRVWGTTLD